MTIIPVVTVSSTIIVLVRLSFKTSLGEVSTDLDKSLAQRGGVAVLQGVLEVVVRDGQAIKHLLISQHAKKMAKIQHNQ